MRYPDFEITPLNFLGKSSHGRTTMVKEISTGKQVEFLGALNKGEAVDQFKKFFSNEHFTENKPGTVFWPERD